jgi:hypothetical protein
MNNVDCKDSRERGSRTTTWPLSNSLNELAFFVICQVFKPGQVEEE